MPNGPTVFFDTNVLIYAQDPREPAKQAAAEAWLARCWRDGIGRISTQVLNELYANLRRFAPDEKPEVARRIVRRYRAWQPWVVDELTVDQAWDIQDRVSLNYWDALMVAAAQAIGCGVLLTEDLQHDRRIDSLRVVNPFTMSPGQVLAVP
jgi:predicted nucleic acid-binding protein